MSTERLARFKDQAFELGAELGKTGSQVVDATTEFAKAGYSVSESLELAKTALLFQNIADESLTAGESASFIISQMKAFNFTASESIQIIDKINEVSNNYAVSSWKISNGETVEFSFPAYTGFMRFALKRTDDMDGDNIDADSGSATLVS